MGTSLIEQSGVEGVKVRRGMKRLGYKYDKDMRGLGKDSNGKPHKGGYDLLND